MLENGHPRRSKFWPAPNCRIEHRLCSIDYSAEPENTLRPISPITIRSREPTRPRLVLSRKNTIPMIAVPAVPMPVNAAYTVAAGSRFTASAKRKLAGTEQMITTNSGAHLDIGADHFNANGHTTSNTSANRMKNQGICFDHICESICLGWVISPPRACKHRLLRRRAIGGSSPPNQLAIMLWLIRSDKSKEPFSKKAVALSSIEHTAAP
jgi:hypothetical protein